MFFWAEILRSTVIERQAAWVMVLTLFHFGRLMMLVSILTATTCTADGAPKRRYSAWSCGLGTGCGTPDHALQRCMWLLSICWRAPSADRSGTRATPSLKPPVAQSLLIWGFQHKETSVLEYCTKWDSRKWAENNRMVCTDRHTQTQLVGKGTKLCPLNTEHQALRFPQKVTEDARRTTQSVCATLD